MEFIPGFKPSEEVSEECFLVFSEKEQYLACSSAGSPFLFVKPDGEPGETLFLGVLEGRNCLCLSFAGQVSLPAGFEWISFRDAFRTFSPDVQHPVSRGKMLQEWARSHRYCGSCGTPTDVSDREYVRSCPSCGDMWYPRMAPAVIVRITKGDSILLARNSRFPGGFYSHIAGFVDPGESLDQTVQREVSEEVGLRVKNIKFFDSQFWPMPHSLMLAFTAEADGDEDPVPDGVEITDARWFTRDAMPEIPGPGSIAGRMLLDWLSEADTRPDKG